jgi:hypothetical protein
MNITPPETSTLAGKIKAIYPALEFDVDYTLTPNGLDIATWTPRQAGLHRPSLALLSNLIVARSKDAAGAAAVGSAMDALSVFWNSLSPVQQKPLLIQKSTVKDTIESDTHSTVLLINDLADSVTGLTAPQLALKATALALCDALIA